MQGTPRQCKFCGIDLRWDGDKWATADGFSKSCPGKVAHRPDNKLRADQLKGR